MPSNQTANYALSQWERTDKVQMEDFNADNAKLDAALKAAADGRSALQAALNTKGNCTVGVFTYQGTGTHGRDNPTRITFPKMPVAYIIVGNSLLVGRGGASEYTYIYSSSTYANCGHSSTPTWSGNTLSLWNGNGAPSQANSAVTYTVIAFYAES